MNSKPKVMFNPNSEKVEFMYDHQSYVFQPGEKKLMDGAIVYHIERHVKAGLKEYEPEVDGLESSSLAYDKMGWNALKKLGSEKKVFKPGMTKIELIKELAELDESGA